MLPSCPTGRTTLTHGHEAEGWTEYGLGVAQGTDDPLDDFEELAFEHERTSRVVYRKGTGPAVVVMAEMPGITPKVADFARRIVDIGCTVWMPVLFGTPGKAPSPGYTMRSIGPACVAREFAAFATGRTAPVTVWLRALAAHAHAESGGPGVGAIGMCFTGGFALGMTVDDRMLAPVLSQPSLPIAWPGRLGRAQRRDLHLAPADLDRVKQRTAGGLCVLGLRFTGDPLSPPARFASLRRELGEAFIGVEIDSSKTNAHGIPRLAHSVVTEHLVDEEGHPTRDALQQVLDFFRTRLVEEP
jgi:dienelactone hydrolase